MKRMKLIGFIAALAIIGFSALSLTGCDDDGNKKAPPGKQAGVAVTTPTLNSKNSNSITINAATFPSGNPGGQTIEYGRSATNTAPANWQDGTTFTGLNADTTYYIFARSKANATHNAGQPSTGLSVTTDPSKLAGAVVSIPTLNSKNSNSITINAATFPSGNPGGQTIEYARNTVNITPSDSWQDGTTFTGLDENTTYYIFARSKENTGHHAGQPSLGLSVTTDSDPNRVSTPITNIPAGKVPFGTQILLGTTTVGATIYYTTDGNDPTVFSPVFSSSSPPIKIAPVNNAPMTIKAMATAVGMTVSTVMTAVYTTDLPNIGDIGPGGGIIFYIADGQEGRPLGFTVEGYGNAGVPGYFANYTAHYLEIAPANAHTTTVRWSGSATDNVLIPATTGITSFTANTTHLADPTHISNSIGNGRKDTQIIVAFYADTAQSTNATAVTNTAANYAANYTTTVGSVTYNDWFLPSAGELNLLYQSTSAVSGMPTTDYFWSSSQSYSTNAWLQNFSDGGRNGYTKNDTNSVRSVRAF